MMNKVMNELKKRIEDAGFEAITITMKCNGDHITITPCSPKLTALSWEDVDYFLLDSEVMNLCGDESLEKIASTIVGYEDLLKKDAEDLENLKAHIRKYGEDSDWDFVSDYHKDLFGHRPRVPHSQIIKWAHSDSTGSARFFQ